MIILFLSCAGMHVLPPPSAVEVITPDSEPLAPFEARKPNTESMNTEYYVGSEADELAQFELFGQQMQAMQDQNSIAHEQPIQRGVHDKSHGCFEGELVLREDRDARTRYGVFADQYTDWPVLVRLSNGVGHTQADSVLDVRGFAMKLMGVSGVKMMDDEQETQDFLFVSTPSSAGKNAEEFMGVVDAGMRGKGALLRYAFSKPRTVLAPITRAKGVDSMISAQYWSGAAFHLGAHQAVKMTVKSCEPYENSPDKSDPDYLRVDLVKAIESDICFTFYVQLQIDPKRTPIENASVVWETEISPEIPVADVYLRKQDFDNSVRDEFCESLSFNPWHGISAHQPMGNQNRARRYIYNASQRHRGKSVEPTAPEIVVKEEPIEYCDFETKKSECIDQMVQIKGSTPNMVMNHSMILSPIGNDSVQSYLDVGDSQWIILSDSKWYCQGEVEVSGILQEYDMGGKEGTRGSYRNFYVSESEIRCILDSSSE